MPQGRSSALFKPALGALYKGSKVAGINEELFLKYHLGALDEKLQASPENTIIAKGSGAKTAASIFEYLPWDSSIFKVKMGRLDYFLPAPGDDYHSRKAVIRKAIDAARKSGLKFLSAKVGLGDFCGAQVLEESGFILKDILVSFLCPLKNLKIEKPPDDIRVFRPSDLKQILNVAGNSFVFNRFFNDARLDKDRSRLMYKEWVKNACARNFLDVLVYSRKGRIPGFVLCKTQRHFCGQIDLVAVSPAAKNKGIGTKLVRAALYNLKKEGMKIAEIRTQHANVPAVNSFLKAGLNRYTRGFTLPSGLVFHKWLQKDR